MKTAVVLLWAGCLWSIARSLLCLLLTARPWRRLLVLAVLALALACCRSPEEMRKNHQETSCAPLGHCGKITAVKEGERYDRKRGHP